MENTEVYQLSDQALGSLMMALQKSLLEESDIIPVLKGFQFINTNAGLEVTNPPVVRIPNKDLDDTEDN
tara:strand:- start:945 stop:1151 length:207 start_codon:yes stop_codon:yes gene_type:complete